MQETTIIIIKLNIVDIYEVNEINNFIDDPKSILLMINII
jgi:hypothetical protein